MEFTGRIFFDFDSFDVARIYDIALKAARDRSVGVMYTWEEFLVGEIDRERPISPKVRALGACAAVRAAHPDQHQRFAQAMLTLIYQEKDDPKKDTTLAVAARVAGLDADEVIARSVDPGLDLLTAGSAEARKLGVVDVPTIIDNGPPLLLRTTAAANYGSAIRRLDLINRMLHDDGIWSMTKP